MMRERDAGFALDPEHAHRQASDRARDAVAIEVEGGGGGGANIVEGVHLHAVDQGEEILLRQIEVGDRLGE